MLEFEYYTVKYRGIQVVLQPKLEIKEVDGIETEVKVSAKELSDRFPKDNVTKWEISLKEPTPRLDRKLTEEMAKYVFRNEQGFIENKDIPFAESTRGGMVLSIFFNSVSKTGPSGNKTEIKEAGLDDVPSTICAQISKDFTMDILIPQPDKFEEMESFFGHTKPIA